MASEKLRLGGMALRNGLLIHGPTHWAAAVRGVDGTVEIASERKPELAPRLAARLPGLRGPLKLHRSPAPLTVQERAGGKTEWVRGASEPLVAAVAGLAERGYYVHPLRPWLHAAMLQRADRLFSWSAAQLPEEGNHHAGHSAAETALRDALDAYQSLDIDPRPWLPEHVMHWYG